MIKFVSDILIAIDLGDIANFHYSTAHLVLIPWFMTLLCESIGFGGIAHLAS